MSRRALSPPALPPLDATKRVARGVVPVSGLASLPPHLAQSILLAAVPAYEQTKLTTHNAHLPERFSDFASVSKHWRTLALDAASNVALCSIEVAVVKRTRKELLELRRQLTLRRSFLLVLDIRRIPPTGVLRADQWAALLSCVPKLQEVKLDGLLSSNNAQLGAIVGAAGSKCTQLQSLVVSAAHRHNQNVLVPAESVRRQLSDAVYYTMEKVYEHTHHVGLRRLCVSMRHDLQGLASTRKFLDRVLRFCPNLERFDGYRAAVFAVNERTSYEQWFMDLELWARFCATLHQLVEFDWICMPFATRFFEVFSQHLKPKMKTLNLTTAKNWKWDLYMRDIGPVAQAQLTETGFAATAKNAHATLKACPNLTSLRVAWYHQALSPSQLAEPLPPLPVETMMDPEIFGDEFWEAAAQFCPLLTSITMLPVSETQVSPTVRSFTDRSLRALARLPHLSILEADSIDVSGDGVFDLAVHHAPSLSSKHHRHVLLSLGEREPDSTDERFYAVVTRFLERMLAADAPLPCMARSSTMALENNRTNPVDSEWSTTYLAHLKTLIQQVKAKHDGVVLSVFATDCDGTSFTQISDFVFDTDQELTHMWMEEGDTSVADSIWRRMVETDEGSGAYYFYDDDDDDDDSEHLYGDDSESDSDGGVFGEIWGDSDDGHDDDDW